MASSVGDVDPRLGKQSLNLLSFLSTVRAVITCNATNLEMDETLYGKRVRPFLNFRSSMYNFFGVIW